MIYFLLWVIGAIYSKTRPFGVAFFAFKEVVEPRLLYELIVPNDIISIVEKISISETFGLYSLQN